jgi:hypothetical protein
MLRVWRCLVTAHEHSSDNLRGKSFKQFAQCVLGKQTYKQFVQCSGFSDYEQAAAVDVLNDYGFEDNIRDWSALSVPWDAVIRGLLRAVLGTGNCSLYAGCPVLALDTSAGGIKGNVRVTTPQGSVIARRVFLATEIDSVQKLLPQLPLYRRIHGQPFLRMYAQFSGSSAAAMKAAVHGVTVVGSPLQKIIGVSDTVFMVAYCDNQDAVRMHRWFPDGCFDDASGSSHQRCMRRAVKFRAKVARLVEDSLGLPGKSLVVDAAHAVFIKSGTHYNDPDLYKKFGHGQVLRKRVLCPAPNVFVVGEAVSRHQGWVEGALETVDALDAFIHFNPH